MEKINLMVLFGGASSEYEVSLQSAQSILKNLDDEKYDIYPVGITREGAWFLYSGTFGEIAEDKWVDHPDNRPFLLTPDRASKALVVSDGGLRPVKIDCVFPVLHGENGEDGSMQGLFELCELPYVGCGVTSSAICMDKEFAKIITSAAGVKQAAWLKVDRRDFDLDAERCAAAVEGRFSYPVFVKPANTGSSVGISKAKDKNGLKAALELAFCYDKKAVVEEFIEGMEIEISVLGNYGPVTSCCGRILPSREFYSYESKYIDGTSGQIIPADIPKEVSESIAETAKKIFTLLGCEGLARVDFFVKKGSFEIYFNEINTLPGFTPISMYPKLFEQSGIPYPKLLDRLIGLALERDKRGRADG